MSLKDNFNQAVKELLKRDGLVGSDLSKGSKEKSELDRYIDTPSDPAPINAGAQVPVQEQIPSPQPEPVVQQIPKPQEVRPVTQTPAPQPAASAAPKPSASSSGGGGQTPPPSAPKPVQPSAEPYFETEETTIISRNTIIDGNVRSFANINIEGSIKGDVQITKNANISGKVVGDLECNNATMLGSSMQGNISSKGQVKLDKDSLILGDIAAQYLDLNGKIKGNVEIGGKAEFKTDAVILGNINAATITVLDGATIQGFVNTTFLQDNAQNLFPEEIGVTAE